MIRKGLLLVCICIFAAVIGFSMVEPAAADNVIVVTTTDDVINANDSLCSLREAILAANNNTISLVGECARGSASNMDVIQLQGGETYHLTIAGAGEDAAQTGDLDILDNATPDIDIMVQGVGGTAVVSINGQDRVWHVHGAGFTLENVETRGGLAPSGGGLHNENGQVNLQSALFTLNNATAGGAVSSTGANADLRLNDVEISRNMTSNFGSGGGIHNELGQLIIIDSEITGNQAMGNGGGLLNKDASAILTRTRISGNEAGDCGGGIANTGAAVMTLIDSDVTGINKADDAGGGLCNQATMSITQNSVVSTNEAKKGGGGIYNNGDLTIRNSLIENNSALDPNDADLGLGGGIYAVNPSTTTMTQSSVVNNNAETAGGGIVMDGTLLAFNNTISNNFASVIGGMFVQDNGNATLVNVTMADNEAFLALAGTGLHILNGSAAIGNSIIANTTQGLDTCTNASGTLSSLGHNLGDDDTCFGEVTDMINTDPMLAPLANGIRTPLLDSPVVDAAESVMCTETAVSSTDQLGTARPQFAGCDIGAIEWQGVQVYLPMITK